MSSVQQKEYTRRINLVLDYIEENLDQELSLAKLSQVASFSPYHFHRIFSAVMGERLNGFIQRIRLERAANKLITNSNKSITEIALECGFSGSAPFARAFKNQFGVSASRWRNGSYQEHSKIGQNERKNDQPVSKGREEYKIRAEYLPSRITNPIWRIEMKSKSKLTARVEVKSMPEIHVAYIRHIGPYKGDGALFEGLMNKLMQWAGPRDLIKFPESKLLTIYYDDPEVTADEKLRMDVCLTVPADTEVDGEIGKTSLKAGKYAIAHFEIGMNEYQDAWNAVYAGWLPESGYQPDDGPCYELYHNSPDEHPDKKHILDICLPVKPL